MKKVIASAGLVALGAVSLQPNANADLSTGPDKNWAISGTLRGFYDDNVATVPNGTPGKFGSAGFQLMPSLSYKFSDGPTSLSVAYIYSLYYFASRPGNKFDNDHEFDLTFNHTFNAMYALDLEESFVDAQDPGVVNSSSPGSAPLRANGDNLHNSVSLNFHDQITRLFGVVLGYNNNFLDYTGNPAGFAGPSYSTLLNSLIHTFSLDGRWQYDEETVGIAEYKFAYTDYTGSGNLNGGGAPLPGNPSGFVPSSTRNNYANIVDIGVEHSFTPTLGVNAHVGIEAVDYYNYNNSELSGGSAPDSFGPYADLSFNWTYNDGGVFTLGFSHAKTSTDVGFAPGANGGLTEDQESSTLFATLAQQMKFLTPNLTGSATFQFQDSVLNGGGYNGLSEDFYTIALDLSYSFTPNFSCEVGYDYDLLTSQVPGFSYDRNRVFVGISATY